MNLMHYLKKNKAIVTLFVVAGIIRAASLNVIAYVDELFLFWAAKDLSNYGFNYFFNRL